MPLVDGRCNVPQTAGGEVYVMLTQGRKTDDASITAGLVASFS